MSGRETFLRIDSNSFPDSMFSEIDEGMAMITCSALISSDTSAISVGISRVLSSLISVRLWPLANAPLTLSP